MTPRRTTTGRGLGYKHQRQRAKLIPQWLGQPCPLGISERCVGIMTVPTLMDLDHSQPRALGGTLGDRMVCRYCNRKAGAILGNNLRGAHYQEPEDRPGARHSRIW